MGVMLDLFTQKMPYSGRGINQSSDAFAPQSEVILYALVTYNDAPVANKYVAFEVYGPTNPYNTYTIPPRTASSNESGVAMIKFRLPWPDAHREEIVFGTWFAVASVEVSEKRATDTLTFRVGWIVEIVSITTIDEDLKPKTVFAQATCVGVKLHLRNIAMLPKTATIVVTAYDALENPFGSTIFNDFNVESGETYVFAYCFLNISEQAAIGNGVVNASAYTAPLMLGGLPWCPEVSAKFVIVPRDVAVINVTVSAIDVLTGQIVNVTVTVKNKGNVTETFFVGAYYGEFMIQSPISVDSLAPEEERDITFVWNTTYVSAGRYTIKAVADSLPGETERGDNIKIGGDVLVRVPMMFPRGLSIVALIVAASIALFAIILLITKRKKKYSSASDVKR